jgi:hypothetical protein
MNNLLYKIVIITCLFFSLRSQIQAQYFFADSLICQGVQADVGETFRTGLATTFGHYTNSSYFKEPDGTEHLAYIDNYKLFYLKSTDNGVSWSKVQITTGHEGDLYINALTVDTAGNIFIGIIVHDLFNYANPTGITTGSQYFLYDAYCVTNKTGSWVTELVNLHSASNYGPKVMGLFVDASNNVHFVANYYGWMSYGGTAWEWVRNSGTNTWGARSNIVQFTDMPVDRLIYDMYKIVPDQLGNVTILMVRNVSSTTTAKPRLFYVRFNGTSWQAPVTLTDSIAVAWDRFDAWVDPAGHTYMGYLQNNTLGMPELRVMKDFQPYQVASINLAANDTLYYFRVHCNAEGLFTMNLWIKNKNVNLCHSTDGVNWSGPTPTPDNMKNYLSGMFVKTDTRRGYFTEYCEQVSAIAGPRSAQPYGPDTLLFGSIRILALPMLPGLQTPPNATIVDTSIAYFTWNVSFPEVTHYWFEIDTTSGFTTPFIDSTITDTNYDYSQLEPYKTYYWRVKAKNQRGWGEFSESFQFNAVFTSVGTEKTIPTVYQLSQNYPNPFNPTTIISYQLPAQSHVTLIIFDVLGREVVRLIDEQKPAGKYTATWNAEKVPSGVYYFRLQAGNFTETKKLLLIR